MKIKAFLILTLFFPVFQPTVSAGNIQFEIISGQQSGLKQIMETWHSEEMSRQEKRKTKHTHGWWPWGLTAIDIDNDGDMDLIPSHHGIPGALIIKNLLKETGKLRFINFSKQLKIDNRNLPGGIGFRTIAMDLNNDGWLDFVGIRSENFINQTGQNFVSKGKGIAQLFPVRIEDVNHDGFLDIIEYKDNLIFNPNSFSFESKPIKNQNKLPVLPKNIREEIESTKTNTRFWNYRILTNYDLNDDQIDDVIVAGLASYRKKPLGYYFLTKKDGSISQQITAKGLPKNAYPNAVVDLNNDGLLDILVSENETESGVYLNRGNGQFKLNPGPVSEFFSRVGPYVQRIISLDLDADGDFDLITSNQRLKQERVFENTGSGSFITILKANGWDSKPIAVKDINGDNLPDIAIGGPNNDITIYLNRSKMGNFSNLYTRMQKPNWAAAGTLIEIFKTGTLGITNAKPIQKEYAHADGTPVFVGLGKDESFDLRITFPAIPKKIITLKNVKHKPRLQITPDGKITEPELGAFITKK